LLVCSSGLIDVRNIIRLFHLVQPNKSTPHRTGDSINLVRCYKIWMIPCCRICILTSGLFKDFRFFYESGGIDITEGGKNVTDIQS
jgi:hypothetical protein